MVNLFANFSGGMKFVRVPACVILPFFEIISMTSTTFVPYNCEFALENKANICAVISGIGFLRVMPGLVYGLLLAIASSNQPV